MSDESRRTDAPIDPASLRLTIRRDRDSAGVLRRMKVLVDGKVVARLRPGAATQVLVLPDEDLRVQARMDWCRSEEIVVPSPIQDGVTVEVAFRLSSFFKIWYAPRSAIDIQQFAKT